MGSQKATCPECGSEFLQETADANGGYCLKCKLVKKSEVDHGMVAEKMEVGLRLLLAVIFACVFAGLGYGIGAVIWTGVGVLLAVAGFPIGAVYGFFCPEINAILRGAFRWLISFGGD